MSNLIQFDNYRDEIEKTIRETRQTIEVAMTLILRREDGPASMMAALKDIHEMIDKLESDLSCAHSNFDDMSTLLQRVRRQRDRVIRERDGLITALERHKREDEHRLYW
jgi:hypothetical protein